MPLSTVTVTGSWVTPSNTFATGQVTFAPVQDAPGGGYIVVAAGVTVQLINGAISQVLVNNAQATTLQYLVTEQITNSLNVSYVITPTGSTLDLSTAPRGTVGATTPVYVLASTVGQANGVAALDSNGKVLAAELPGALVYNVKDYGIGAGGDDYAATQALMNAASAAGGGYIYTPPNLTVSVSQAVAPRSNVTLIGAGPTSVWKTTANGHIVATDSTTPVSDFSLEDLTFVGPVNNTVTVPTRARTTSGPGADVAVWIDGSLDTTGSYPLITNFSMRGCRVRNTTWLPIRIFGVTGKVEVSDSEFTNCMDVGFGYCEEVICADNHSKMSADNGFSISRGCQKITCTGNTVENCAYYGIWLAGFTGTPGPTDFACTGNTVRGCGQAGVVLMDAPSYGVVSGNMIDKQYYRGPAGSLDDTTCCGIYVRGSSTSLAAPAWFSAGLNITGNTIKAAAKAGIYLTGAVGVKVTANLMVDCGTQYWADGTTLIPANYSSQNVGVYTDPGGPVTNVEITNNTTVDTRVTPYCNYGVMPLAVPGVTAWGNTMAGCRNASNLPNPVRSDTLARVAGAQETIPRWAANNATISTNVTGTPVIRFAYFTAEAAQPMNKISFSSGNTAVSGTAPTLIRYGLYTVDSSGNLTQIGQTASDTTIFAAASTYYSRSITTAGLIATSGQLYCVACIIVTTGTFPTLQGAQAGTAPDNVVAPLLAGSVTGGGDLAASYTAGSISPSQSIVYARVTT